MKLIDIAGQRFGRLIVVRKVAAPKMWLCLCDCGAEKLVTGANLRNGSIESCGCKAKDWASKMGSDKAYIRKRADAITKHGHKRRTATTATYKTWIGMKRRCYDPKCKDYPNWGGRGIKVCESWNSDFSAFLRDMGEKPDGMTIDRVNPNLDYSPENCRWATVQEQGADHKRSNIPTEVDGVLFPSISAACRHYGVTPQLYDMRIKAGWSADKALKTPRRKRPSQP